MSKSPHGMTWRGIGPEWPTSPVFPTDMVDDGEILSFDVLDIGPGEPFHDSVFVHTGPSPSALVGDVIFSLMHAYMAHVQNLAWITARDHLKSELPGDMILHVGHGAPVTPALLQWQKTYLERFDRASDSAACSDPDAATASVMQAMQAVLPGEDLAVLWQLSIAPNAQAAGKL